MGSMPERKKEKATMSEEKDELAAALAQLVSSISAMVEDELEGTNNQLKELEKMNRRVTEEYKSFGNVASGLRVFVEQLSQKNGSFNQYLQQIDAVEQQVTQFEAVIAMLDKHVKLLEDKVRSAYRNSPI